MTTEAIDALTQVREVEDQLQPMLNDTSLHHSERLLIEQVLSDLYEIDDTIILLTLESMVAKLNAYNDDLKKLINRMEMASDKIAAFSNTVKKISDVIGVLGVVTAKAISEGIIK